MKHGLAHGEPPSPDGPAAAESEAVRHTERMILRPTGTGGLIMRVLLAARDTEFDLAMLVRRTRALRPNINSALDRLESLGFVDKRHDYHATPLRGGAAPRWYRITDKGHHAAVREGLTPALPPEHAGAAPGATSAASARYELAAGGRRQR
ncbi:MAG TPA: hypothetical protein VHX38_26880 [Pseudonocardiaceae bacterium]|jgi:hypothetical protein|nr:hypothetical protein [Pseudonocardiaceae bacterium]